MDTVRSPDGSGSRASHEAVASPSSPKASIPSADIAPLRVWWIPQIPGEPFYVNVPDLATADLLLNVLANYDTFQFENNIKPDYCNTGGLQMFEDGDWYDWYDDALNCEFDEWREIYGYRAASAMSARSAESEGLSPQDASAVPQADAQPIDIPSEPQP